MATRGEYASARQAIDALTGAKRMCAEVHPVMHKVKESRKVAGAGKGKSVLKTRHVTKPTGTYLVKLFEGGLLKFPTDSAAQLAQDQLNIAIRALVREATAGDRTCVHQVMDADDSLHFTIELQQALFRLEKSEQMQLNQNGPALFPETEGLVTLLGDGAEQHAEWLAGSINKALKPFVDRCYKDAYAQLTECTKLL
jgi:hypothetical protein